eukprot:514730-Pyramimonas_sp.AAC.1
MGSEGARGTRVSFRLLWWTYFNFPCAGVSTKKTSDSFISLRTATGSKARNRAPFRDFLGPQLWGRNMPPGDHK